MSGSVCSKFNPIGCNNCDPYDQCRDFTVSLDTCCENFRDIQDFTIDMVTALDKFDGDKSYSMVQFASGGTLEQFPSDKASTIDSVNQLDYTGGATNHGQAINKCRQALQDTTSNNKYMLVITDGVSTAGGDDPAGVAIDAANRAKEDDIFIIPVFVMTSENLGGLDFMSEISSDGKVFNVTDFGSLNSLETQLVEQVSCSSIETPEPTKAPQDTPLPPTSVPSTMPSCVTGDSFDLCLALGEFVCLFVCACCWPSSLQFRPPMIYSF